MRKIKIKKIRAKKILNSAGNFSIEVTIQTENGTFSSSIPKGTSKGKHEAKEFTNSIGNAVNVINNTVSKNLKKAKINSLNDILNFEKKTKKYGGDVVLSVSFSLLKALSVENNTKVWKMFKPKKKKIPLLLNKMLGGGLHAGKRAPDFQEFLVLGKFKNINENIKQNLGIYKRIQKKYSPDGKDLEGGWVLEISNENAFSIIKNFKKKCKIGCDFAASSLYNKQSKKYVYKDGRRLTSKEQIGYILSLQKKFGIYYLEDPLHEDDFKGFAEIKKKIGKRTLIVGDDLLTTNPVRLKKSIKKKSCNSCIVKPDQIGSLTKVIEFVKLAKKKKYIPVISHRSAETNDDILADIAVGLEIPIMKIGIVGGERVTKINRLVEISDER